MTTTAEEISQLHKRMDRMSGWIADIGEQLNKLEAEQNIKPPDPGPLECWVNIYSVHLPIHAFKTKTEALISAGNANSAYKVRTAVRMREVTP